MGRARSRKIRPAPGSTPRPVPRPRPTTLAGPSVLPYAVAAVWWSGVVLLLVFTALRMERMITWYLAVDQFGYLAFAHDLLAGHVFHEWPPIHALASQLPPRTDVLMQTYVYDHGLLHCRYAPGFPILLAGWLAVFGDDGAHYLNPTLFIAVIALLIAYQRRLFHSRWRALAGAALLVLFPSFIHLWGLTVTRDLSAHLVAFVGLFILLPWRGRRLGPLRAAAAALALGFAASIRPDGVIYLLPAALLASARWRRENAAASGIGRALAAAALAYVVGVTPLLAYNWIATGNPLRATQGMEVQQFMSAAPRPGPELAQADTGGLRVGYPPRGWHGGTLAQVQGGGLRLSNLPRTLPGNLALMRDAYGPVFLAAALWGACVALALRPMGFLLSVPYVVTSLLFYSCWARPDTRYLIGMHLFISILIVEGLFGTFDVVRVLARRRRPEAARVVAIATAVALTAAAIFTPARAGSGALPTIGWLVPLVLAAGLGFAAWRPGRRVVGIVAPLLALVLAGIAVERASEQLGRRASFQRPDVLYARANFEKLVEPGAVVITTEDVGRPAENIEYYTRGAARALYLTDLDRWRISVHAAAVAFLGHGMKPYLFIPTSQPDKEAMLDTLRKDLVVAQVADIPAQQAIDYFVAAPYHRGVQMELYSIRLPAWVAPWLPEGLSGGRSR